MKCENCGKEEVNFHFTSNINGNITEKHLCAECAAKLGFDRTMTRPEASFEEIFMDLFGARPPRRMQGGYGLVFPTIIIPTVGMLVPGTAYEGSGARPETQAEVKPEIDTEMQKRREINIMREQMLQAAKEEDYEKAAALRDSIKKLENGENS
jgi:protein arginine kinase activator